MNYYNEIDPFAAQWLKNLISAGLIPSGDVDQRSIADVQPEDLKGYTQCHFFAGIGGWSRALEFSGWNPNRPVWTGSCPCQSLSVAGLKKGHKDERHLWPEFARLICECQPSTVFGEQVASKLGREWLSGVRLDMETMGYVVGAADLCAACVGAPHIRQRLWWVADSISNRLQGRAGIQNDSRGEQVEVGRNCNNGFWSNSIWWPCRDGKWRRVPGWVGDTARKGRATQQDRIQKPTMPCEPGGSGGIPDSVIINDDRGGFSAGNNSWERETAHRVSAINPIYDTRHYRLGVESAIFPLAPRLPGRVGILRGAGNAIVPQVAAEFIKAYMELNK